MQPAIQIVMNNPDFQNFGEVNARFQDFTVTFYLWPAPSGGLPDLGVEFVNVTTGIGGPVCRRLRRWILRSMGFRLVD
jgi:hypothetical protein